MKMFFLPLEGCTFLHQNRALKMDDSRTFPVDVSFPFKNSRISLFSYLLKNGADSASLSMPFCCLKRVISEQHYDLHNRV